MSDLQWAALVMTWDRYRDHPRLCRVCGGLGRRRRWFGRGWRECKACHGSGGAVWDERAWWDAK